MAGQYDQITHHVQPSYDKYESYRTNDLRIVVFTKWQREAVRKNEQMDKQKNYMPSIL